VVRHIVAAFTVQQFLSHLKSPGEVLYKLGILVPILECRDIPLDP
jgi:hypothetical protein